MGRYTTSNNNNGGESESESESDGISLSKICYQIWFQLLVICALIFTLVALPPTLLVLSFIYLFRLLVFHSSRYLRPDLGKMLSTRSSIFGSDLIYQKPLCSLIGKHVYEGSFDLSEMRAKITDKWVNARRTDGSLRNPELTQSVTQYLGFLFWKSDPNFSVENHVNVLQSDVPGQIITDAKLNSIMSTIISRPFQEGRSPWSVFVVPNYVPDKDTLDDDDYDANDKQQNKMIQENNNNSQETDKIMATELSSEETELKSSSSPSSPPPPKFVILIHWNHSLMDGLSISKLYLDFTNASIDSFFPKPKNPPRLMESRRNECTKLLDNMSFIVRAPYQSIRTPIESVDFNPWHLKESELTKKMDMAFTPKIPMDSIREVRDAAGVTFNSVVFSIVTGAIRRFLIADSRLTNRDKILPASIHCGFPYPLPNHPEKLRNHMTFCTVQLPVGTSDPLSRLCKMDKHLKRLKRSTVPIMAFLIMPFVGALFTWMLRFLVKNRNTTAMFSNMPGPSHQVTDAMGFTLRDTMFSVGLGPGSLGIALTAASYNGQIRFCAELDTAFSSDRLNAQDLAKFLVDEFNVLRSCSRTNEV